MRSQSPAAKAKAPMQRANGTVNFKYYKENYPTEVIWWNFSGTQEQEFAIYIPGTYAGKQITNISFTLNTTSGVSKVKCWASKSLPSNGSAADLCQEVSNAQQNNNVQLQSPYTIPDGGCYIGYSFTATGGTDGAKVVWYYTETVQPESNYRRADNLPDWIDYSADKFCSTLCATIAGNYDTEAATIVPNKFEKVVVSKGETVSTTAEVTNMGTNTMKSITYVVTDAATGEELVKKTCDTTPTELGETTNITFDLGNSQTPGMFNRAITITEVNGRKNAIQKTCSGSVCVLAAKYARKIVIEEGTGTWCGWCPRGIVGMEKMAQKYPDNFIGIAIHNDDEMQVSESYYPIFNYFQGFPSCIANRQQKYITDPNEYDLEKIILAEKEYAMAKIEAQAYFTDDSRKEVTVNTTSQFGYADSNNKSKIAYVVIENNVGPYNQLNAYAGSGDLEGWGDKGSYVSTLYNDVARAIYDYNGIAGSTPTAINTEETYSYSYTFTLPNNIQNVSNIEIVTLLIDNETVEIMNADKVVPGTTPTGISSTVDKANDIVIYAYGNSIITNIACEQLHVYDTAGKEVANKNLTAGMYIVKAINNGQTITRKVIVK